MQRFLTIGLLLFVAFEYVGGNYWAAHWFIKWAILLYVLSFFISVKIAKDVSWWLFLPIMWTLHSSMRVWAWHGMNRYRDFPLTITDEFRVVSSTSESTFLLLVVFFVLLRECLDEKHFQEAYKWLCYALCVSVLFFWGLYHTYGVITIHDSFLLGKNFVIDKTAGPLGNLSMTGCLIATCWPMTLKFAKRWWLLTLLPVVTVCFMDSSQPVLLMALTITTVLMGKYQRTHGTLPRSPVFLTGFALAMCGLLYVGGHAVSRTPAEFFDLNGRAWAINLGYQFMKDIKWYLTGVGLNLTTSLLPVLNNLEFKELHLSKQSEASFWFWFHSDWFQSFFEMGVVGFLAYLSLFMKCVWESWKRDYLLSASVIAWGAMAVFNFPVHLPVHAFIGCSLVWMSLSKPPRHGIVN
jgi:hypothetical protein